jgi:TonB family protein
MRTLFVLFTTLLSTSALAVDDGSGDLQKLLDNLPTIEQKPLPTEEKPKAEEADMDLPAYLAIVRDAVIATWHPPKKLVDKHPSLNCQLLVKVHEDGTVGDVVMMQPSGNGKFDKSAGAAALATTSVMPPPISLRGTAEAGVTITFVAAMKKGG